MLTGVFEKIAGKMQPILEIVGTDHFDIIREVFADDAYDGQSKTETTVNRHPVAGIVHSKNSSRVDEGGKWQSYLKTTVQFSCLDDGQPLEVRITDKLRTIETDLNEVRTFTIQSIGYMNGVPGVVYEIGGEWDVREGQRVNGV